MEKEELLNQIKQLKKAKRKPRSDKGLSRVCTKERADKNIVREQYTRSSKYYQKLFMSVLAASAIRNAEGEVIGEGATRDANDIFDLRVKKKWRSIKRRNGISYITKVTKPKVLENYRWDYLHALAVEDNTLEKSAIKSFCKRYFIREQEWDLWTFSEWAAAYEYMFAGYCNNDGLLIPYLDNDGKIINYRSSI